MVQLVNPDSKAVIGFNHLTKDSELRPAFQVFGGR
jgi:hypothetical protein